MLLLLSLSFLPLFFFLPAKQSGASVIGNRIYYYKLLLLGYKLCVEQVAGHKMSAGTGIPYHTHSHTLPPPSAQIRDRPTSHAALGFILSLSHFWKTQPPLNVKPDLCSTQRAPGSAPPSPHPLPHPPPKKTKQWRPN